MTTNLDPRALATRRRELAMDYKDKLNELAEIRKKKVFKIIELLAEHKTISKAELYFSATDEGQREIEIELYCKGIIELIRTVKTELDIMQSEAWGQF